MSDETIVRKELLTSHRDYTIHVTTERLPGGRWAVVAALHHRTERGEVAFDLPVPDETFDHQADAEDYGARLGLDWLEQNAPRTAA